MPRMHSRLRRIAAAVAISAGASAVLAATADGAPSADFTIEPDAPFVGDAVTLRAEAACGITVVCSWAVDGEARAGKEVQATFSTAGTHTVSLEVDDLLDLENAVRGERSVEVRPRPTPNLPPVAAPTADPGRAFTQQPVTFTAHASDSDGVVVAYGWDVNGGFDDGDQPTLVRRFSQPGTKTLKLRVTDDDGATHQSKASVVIENRRPLARFTYAPETFGRGEAVTFSSAASDPEDRLDENSLRWDLDGDGQFDDAAGPEAERRFTSSEPVQIGLRVADLDGASDEQHIAVTAGNAAPDATIRAGSAVVGVPVALEAVSSDRDGRVVAHAWDLDDDGAFDDGDDASAVATFTTAGAHLVAVQVTDDDGATQIAHRIVDVGTRSPSAGGTGDPPSAGDGPGTGRLPFLEPFPVVRYAGRVAAPGARLRLFSVRAPRGARINVACLRAACRAPVRRLVATGKRKRIRAYERTYHAGARIVVRITRAGHVGKHVQIRIRRGRAPARRDRCLMPGATRPSSCSGR